MQFKIAAILAFAAVSTASAIPETVDQPTEFNATEDSWSLLEARDTYDCKGSSLCSSLNVAACDTAVNNNIIRNDDINYGAPGSGRPNTGACASVFGGYGCGVFIQGQKNCARSGNQIWWDYQDIRNNGCQKCGSKHWGDGCLTTINYVSGCSS